MKIGCRGEDTKPAVKNEDPEVTKSRATAVNNPGAIGYDEIDATFSVAVSPAARTNWSELVNYIIIYCCSNYRLLKLLKATFDIKISLSEFVGRGNLIDSEVNSK